MVKCIRVEISLKWYDVNRVSRRWKIDKFFFFFFNFVSVVRWLTNCHMPRYGIENERIYMCMYDLMRVWSRSPAEQLKKRRIREGRERERGEKRRRALVCLIPEKITLRSSFSSNLLLLSLLFSRFCWYIYKSKRKAYYMVITNWEKWIKFTCFKSCDIRRFYSCD